MTSTTSPGRDEDRGRLSQALRQTEDFPHIRWEELHTLAVDAAAQAYVPISGYRVGVAGQTTDGRVFSGCNVENASLGITLCAECGMVSQMVREGGGRLEAVVCVDADEKSLVPCGRCRQLLYEHGGKEMLLLLDGVIYRLVDLLPMPFGPEHLAASAQRRARTLAGYATEAGAD